MNPRALPTVALAAITLLMSVGAQGAGGAVGPAVTGVVLRTGAPDVVDGSYVVVFKDTVAPERVAARANQLAKRYGSRAGSMFRHAVRGFEVTLSDADAERLAADPAVAYVQENAILRAAADPQVPVPSWGLDRIDQRVLPGNTTYRPPALGSGVKAYIIDSGIRLSHQDFQGRAVTGADYVDGGTADDANGHGTLVAGVVGGHTYGVAKDVTLVSVRVADAAGVTTTARTLQGIDYVTANHSGPTAVAVMSFAGQADQAVDDAVVRSIRDGVHYSVAAGNEGRDACNVSPARAVPAMTVAATTQTDQRAAFSNTGRCVDIFAPGQDIVSTAFSSDTAFSVRGGTSMAAAHVAGAAAVRLGQYYNQTPDQVSDALYVQATGGVVGNPGDTVNKLLYVVQPFINYQFPNGRLGPSIAVSPHTGEWRIAFHDGGTRSLYRFSSFGGGFPVPGSPGLGHGTSPSIAVSPEGGFYIAFQGTEGLLALVTPQDAVIPLGLGLAPGTSPSIAVSWTGEWRIAFQANTGALWTRSSNGTGGPVGAGHAMAPSTSPSIVALPSGGFQIAYQTDDNHLGFVSPTGLVSSLGVGMMPGTSPSMAVLPSGEWRIAVHANTGILWTRSSNGQAVPSGGHPGHEVMPASSPAIAAVPSAGFQIVYHTSDGLLGAVSPTGVVSGLGLGVSTPTSPAIAAPPWGEWHAAFADTYGWLWRRSSTGAAERTPHYLPG